MKDNNRTQKQVTNNKVNRNHNNRSLNFSPNSKITKTNMLVNLILPNLTHVIISFKVNSI